MSKLDAQRALREAKYARNSASGPTRREAAAAGATSGASTAPPSSPRSAKAAKPAAGPEGERCGHKSMNGRACTRDAAHSEKSHRYS